jgi:hypothetical protein
MASTLEEIPGIGISYSVQVGDGKNVVFQTAVERDGENLTEIVDKLQKAGDRAVLYSKLEHAQAEFEKDSHMAEILQKNLDIMADKVANKLAIARESGRSKPVLSNAELSEKENADRTLANHLLAKEKWAKKIAAYKAELGL